jgi:hypothetical protein
LDFLLETQFAAFSAGEICKPCFKCMKDWKCLLNDNNDVYERFVVNSLGRNRGPRMLGRGGIASCLVAFLLLTPSFAKSSFAQSWNSPQQRPTQFHGQYFHVQSQQEKPHPQQRTPQVHPPLNQPGHAGNWLRHYKDMSPAQQRRILESDPLFRRLPPQQQIRLQNQLLRFSSLPPQQQERILNRMEVWEHMTLGQKQQARQVFQQFRQLPPDRRQVINRTIRGMRNLLPEQRDQLIDSEQYRNAFSPQERSILHGAAHLPLAPGDGLQAGPLE